MSENKQFPTEGMPSTPPSERPDANHQRLAAELLDLGRAERAALGKPDFAPEMRRNLLRNRPKSTPFSQPRRLALALAALGVLWFVFFILQQILGGDGPAPVANCLQPVEFVVMQTPITYGAIDIDGLPFIEPEGAFVQVPLTISNLGDGPLALGDHFTLDGNPVSAEMTNLLAQINGAPMSDAILPPQATIDTTFVFDTNTQTALELVYDNGDEGCRSVVVVEQPLAQEPFGDITR